MVVEERRGEEDESCIVSRMDLCCQIDGHVPHAAV